MVNLLLYSLTHGYNIGQIIRSAYITGITKVYIFDPNQVLNVEESEVNYHSTGLLKSKSDFIEIVSDLNCFLKNYSGRKISTEIKSTAKSICNFKFEETDLIIVGNERTGIPEEISKLCHASIILPMGRSNYELPKNNNIVAKNWGIFPNFSVAAAADIVCFFAMNSLGKFESFDLEALKNDANQSKREEAVFDP